MIRGTTASFKFKLPYSYDEIDTVMIKFWQSGNPSSSLPIYKYKQHCEARTDNEIYVSLRPSETALFSDKYKAKVQLRACSVAGEAFGCTERLFTVYPMPDDIMLDDYTVFESDPILNVQTEDGWVVLDGNTITQ